MIGAGGEVVYEKVAQPIVPMSDTNSRSRHTPLESSAHVAPILFVADQAARQDQRWRFRFMSSRMKHMLARGHQAH